MRHRLLWKLGVATLLLLALVLVAVDLYISRTLRDDAIATGFEQLQVIARMAEGRLPQSAEGEALRRWAAEAAVSGARVTVIAADGLVLADSERDPTQLENHAGRPEIQQAQAEGSGRAIRFSDSVRRDLLYLALRRRLSGAESPLVIRFALPLAPVDEAVAALRQRLWLASLMILLVAGAAGLWFSRRLTMRIAEMEQFARRVAGGDFRPIPVEREGDELTHLGRALNETAAHLAGTIGSLTEERNRSAAIVRSMVEGVAVIDPEGRVVFLNEAFCRELDIGSEQSEGRPMVEVFRHPDLVATAQKTLVGESSARTEVAIGSGGSQRCFAATAGLVRAGGGATGAVLVLHDITELRRLERVRRDFVANVSHEFKTPLTAIQGFAETLLGGALDDATNRTRFLEIIREHATRLARLTDDLLKLSSIEAGKLDLEFRALSVAELVESCVETTRFRAGQKNLSLLANCAEGLPKVHGDARRLAEILQNLLDNAVQYTPEGGSITVRAFVHTGSASGRDSGSEDRTSQPASDASVAIAVIDTGIGIPQDQLQRIFERFYRVDPARSREAGGTGLGLAIARHLAEAHGGRIEVMSEVGRGSTFTLVLPRA